jgi:hypothetical protein
MSSKIILISETKHFAKLFDKIVGKAMRSKLHEFLANDPQSGVIIRGSKGIRKLRWAKEGSGKSGGVRLIYYFYREDLVLYLLTLFAKNDQDNLSSKEINELAKVAEMIKIKHKGTV